MICPIDRTSELLAALASHHGLPSADQVPVKTADNSQPHEFTITAEKLKERIDDMRAFIAECQSKYHDFSMRGMKDSERDDVDAAVAQFLRTAMSQIDTLKQCAVKELENEPGQSFATHQLGVVVILSEELQEVSKLSETLRGVRIQEAIAQKERSSVQYDAAVAQGLAHERRERDRADAGGDEEDFAMFEQQFAMENASLVTDLVETRERVREAEKTVFEIANLNHVFATKVLEQAREIEVLYDLAVEATTHVDRGNRELRKMKQQGPTLKYGLALLALLLAFALVFLEWMGRRRSLFFI